MIPIMIPATFHHLAAVENLLALTSSPLLHAESTCGVYSDHV